MFRRQRGTEFVFLLTLNVRSTIDQAVTEHLNHWRVRVTNVLQPAIDWYAACRQGQVKYRLKVAIPAFVQRMAEDEGFCVHCYPPIAYVGTASATMVHFVFRCKPTLDAFHSVSPQSPDDLVRLPLLNCLDQAIEPDAEQHAGFDWNHCHQALADVPGDFAGPLQAFVEDKFGTRR